MTSPTKLIAAGPLAGRYRIERELGRGGMATVYVATDLTHSRPVAVKVLGADAASGASAERFVREVEVAARLSHANIVPLFDSGTIDGTPYYVMPLVRGESLRARLDREHLLPVADAIAIAIEVADALAHAHSLGVLHRDIKPENILLEDGHVRVTDFGVAAALTATAETRLTASGIAVGTPVYMSPEQASGTGSLDARSDVYALGCVLYEMLAGEPPFRGPTVQAMLARKAAQPATSIGLLRESVPPALEQVVATALARLPADRYRSADEMARALRACTSGTYAVAATPAIRGRGWWIATGGAGLAALIAFLTLRPEGGACKLPTDETARDVIAVFPFWASAGSDSAGLRHGIVFSLEQALNGSGALRSVNSHRLLATVKQRYDFSPGEACRVAAGFGAGRFILGSIVDAGARVKLSAQIFSDPERPDTAAEVEGPKLAVLALADTLALRLLSTELATKGSVRAAGPSTSLEAIKLYLAGLEASNAGQWRLSTERFLAAVARDSNLFPAWYQLGADAFFSAGDDSVARVGLRRADRFRDRLSVRDRHLLAIMFARDSGSVYASNALVQDFVRRFPGDAEGWVHAGDLLVADHPFLARPAIELEVHYRRAMRLGQKRGTIDVDRLAHTFVRRDRATFDSLWKRMASGPLDHDFAWGVLAAIPFFLGDTAAQSRVITEARDRHEGFVGAALINVAAADPEGALRFARTLTDLSRSRASRVRATLAIAHLSIGLGRWKAADSALAEAEQLDGPEARLHRAWLLTLPERNTPVDSLLQLERVIARDAVGEVRAARAPVWTMNEEIRPMRSYVLGLLAARRGDAEAALRHARDAERAPLPFNAGTLGEDLARGIRAEVQRLRGDLSGALAEFDWTRTRVRFPTPFFSPFIARTRERHLYSVLLDTLRHPDAERWLEASSTNQFLHDYVQRASLLLRLGRLHERHGRAPEARVAYARAAELWRRSDPELLPLRAEAESALVRLNAPRRTSRQ